MPDPISWAHAAPALLAALLFGYLLGSIPFGLLLAKAAGLGDVRKIGSGNIGATNVLRTGNKKVAAATLLLDALKGTVAVLVAWRFGPDAAVLAGLGAFLGHLFPVWLRFKGGKGVATFLGLTLGFHWPATLVFVFTWLGMAYAFRYSSLAALTASVVTAGSFFLFHRFGNSLPGFLSDNAMSLIQIGQLFILLVVLLWVMHRENITRLLRGAESRIGQKG